MIYIYVHVFNSYFTQPLILFYFSFLQSRLNQALINAIESAQRKDLTTQYSKIIELSEVESAKTVLSEDESTYETSAANSNDVPSTSKGPKDRTPNRSRRDSIAKQQTRSRPKSVSSHSSAKSNGSSGKYSKQKESFTSISYKSTNRVKKELKGVYSTRTKPYLKTEASELNCLKLCIISGLPNLRNRLVPWIGRYYRGSDSLPDRVKQIEAALKSVSVPALLGA